MSCAKMNKCSKCGKDTLLETCATCLQDKVPNTVKKLKVKKDKIKKSKKNAENNDDFPKLKSKSNIYNKMFKSKSHTLEFTERANVLRAKRLLKMTNDEILDKVYDDSETDDNGRTYSKEESYKYIKDLKTFCKRVILSKGTLKQKYKYSKALKNAKQGRIYVEGFGIQYLQKRLRGYLAGEYSRDVDMKNAFPTLMVWLCENFYPQIKITDLKKYVKKREKLLEKYKTNKLDILAWSNRDFKYTGDNLLIKCLDNVFKEIQSALWNDKENPIVQMVDMKEIKSTNKKGSLLNRVLGIIENDILQQVIEKYQGKISVPYYDGCWFDIEYINDENELITELNEFTKDYGVEWSVKEHATLDIPDEEIEDSDDDDDIDITVDEEEEVQLYGYELIEYEDLKRKFEKNHTVIASPLMICREYIDKYFYYGKMKKTLKYQLYSFANIKELYMNLFYQEIQYVKGADGVERQKIINKPFIKSWLLDPTRRTLEKMDFCPHNPNRPEIAPDNIYNMFHGYRAKVPNANKEYDFDVDAEVQRFINHLKLLVGHEEDAHNYLLNYIADLVQNPHNLPEVALLFKSKQGLGKDLMVNYIEKMIADKYVYRTANVKEVYGDFNPAVRGKLLIQLNEMEGKDGFANKEKLKDSFTAHTLTINEKNVKQFSIRNSIRFIIFSNNLTPVDIPPDDRRFVVFQGGDLLPEKERDDYYNPLFDNLNNDDVMNKILEYFMNIDLSDFNLRRQRPITKAYKEIREGCINPLYKFSYDFLNKIYRPEKFATCIKSHKKLEGIKVIKTTDFHKLYQDWYSTVLKAETTLNFKQIKPLLENIDIRKKEVRIKGYKDYYYLMNVPNVIQKLKDEQKCGVEEEDILELDDDFDDEDVFSTDDEE